MKPWPEPEHNQPLDCVNDGYAHYPCTLCHNYQRARADKWEEVARVAVEALRVAEQARSEVRHAKDVGPNWYTHGERGMHAQVLMWDGKAGEAVAKALFDIGPLPPLPPPPSTGSGG